MLSIRSIWPTLMLSACGFALTALCTLGCTAADTPPPKSSPRAQEQPAPSTVEKASAPAAPVDYRSEFQHLRWLPDGLRVLVDNRFVVDTASTKAAPLPYATRSHNADGSTTLYDVSLSADGAQVVVASGNWFRFGALQQQLSPKITIPPFIMGKQQLEEPEQIKNVLFFINSAELLVQQLHISGAVETGCRRYELKTGNFKPASCVESEFHHFFHAERGPGSLAVLYSAGEGHPGLQVISYDAAQGPKELGPNLDLYPFGPVEVHFADNAQAVYFVSDCPLEKQQRPCEHKPAKNPWAIYRWEVEAKKLTKVHAGLPTGNVPSPNGTQAAWVQGTAVCWAPLGTSEKQHCKELGELLGQKSAQK